MANHWANLGANRANNYEALRLDPCHLPQKVAFSGGDREVVMSLNERGVSFQDGDSGVLRMVHAAQFLGVAASTLKTSSGQTAVVLKLLHEDELACVPLLISRDMDDVLIDWRLWADTYDLPMLLIDEDGDIHPVEERAPLRNFLNNQNVKREGFLLRCRGHSLRLRLMIANQVMLG